MERGRIQGLLKLFGYPAIISGTGRDTNVKFCTHIYRLNRNKKPLKNFAKSSHGRSQGLPKIFRAPIDRAHRAVIFAIAQLSCLIYFLNFVTVQDSVLVRSNYAH